MKSETPTDHLFRQFQIQKFDSKRMVPAVTMTVDVDVTRLMQLRSLLNAHRANHITVTHLVTKAACDVVIDFPLLYASFDGKKVVENPDLILNVPVDIENHVEYLVIHQPNAKSLDTFIAECAAELTKIKQGEGEFRRYIQSIMRIPAWLRRLVLQMPGQDIRILRNHYGNFPISNFGSFGVDRGYVAIAQPMIAALCFGKIEDRVTGNEASKILSVNITFDHRAVDGAYVGHYLSSLRQYLEAAEPLCTMAEPFMTPVEAAKVGLKR